MKLAREFSDQPDIRQRLANYLPEESKKPTGKYWVEFTREGEVFLAGIEMTNLADVATISMYQKASVLVDATLLFTQVVGIKKFVSESAVRTAVKGTVESLQNSTPIRRAIEAFFTAWDEAEEAGSVMEKARALFFLLKDSYAAGILWTIIKSLFQEMSLVDWLKTVAEVFLMLIASLATDGAALMARIGLVVLSAHDFAKKHTSIPTYIPCLFVDAGR